MEAYYNSIFGFVTGMAVGSAAYSEWLKKWRHGYLAGLALMAVSFAAMFAADKDGIAFAAVRNLAGVGAAIVLLYLSSRVDLTWKANRWLCAISPELFFFHLPVALLFSRVLDAPYAYAGLVTLASFALAVLFHWIDGRAHGLWMKLIRGGSKRQ